MHHFISTTIPYVNGAPHIGHAQEFVIADALARYHSPVHFHSGTDENSLKNALAAEAAGIPVSSYVSERSKEFENLVDALGLELTDFVRTSSDERHRPFVEWLWHACEARGDIYRGQYTGLYCIGCEQFFTADELIDGKCPEHGTAPESIFEPNYFFRLSRHQDTLVDLISTGRLKIEPGTKRNEVLAFLNKPLEDLSISRGGERSHGWGIPVPNDKSQVIYVWFDALANYISAPGQERWEQFERVTHVVGKGVLRFHAVYWPAILLSAGLRLPNEILVHNYVTVEGRKIGKSLGNAINPKAPIDVLGLDAFRYYLLRHVGCFRDSDFSWARYREVYNHELANQLGNLVSRVAALVGKHGAVPQVDSLLITKLSERVADHVASFALHRAMEVIWQAVDETNGYLSREQPWKLVGEARGDVLAVAVARVLAIASTLRPFLPTTASRIADVLHGRTKEHLFPKAS